MSDNIYDGVTWPTSPVVQLGHSSRIDCYEGTCPAVSPPTGPAPSPEPCAGTWKPGPASPAPVPHVGPLDGRDIPGLPGPGQTGGQGRFGRAARLRGAPAELPGLGIQGPRLLQTLRKSSESLTGMPGTEFPVDHLEFRRPEHQSRTGIKRRSPHFKVRSQAPGQPGDRDGKPKRRPAAV